MLHVYSYFISTFIIRLWEFVSNDFRPLRLIEMSVSWHYLLSLLSVSTTRLRRKKDLI